MTRCVLSHHFLHVMSRTLVGSDGCSDVSLSGLECFLRLEVAQLEVFLSGPCIDWAWWLRLMLLKLVRLLCWVVLLSSVLNFQRCVFQVTQNGRFPRVKFVLFHHVRNINFVRRLLGRVVLNVGHLEVGFPHGIFSVFHVGIVFVDIFTCYFVSAYSLHAFGCWVVGGSHVSEVEVGRPYIFFKILLFNFLLNLLHLILLIHILVNFFHSSSIQTHELSVRLSIVGAMTDVPWDLPTLHFSRDSCFHRWFPFLLLLSSSLD